MADDKVEFELVSPEKLLLSRAVDMVVVPGGRRYGRAAQAFPDDHDRAPGHHRRL